MLRILWGVTQYGSSTPSVVTVVYAESWAFPIGFGPRRSMTTLVHGIPELVEMGHKE